MPVFTQWDDGERNKRGRKQRFLWRDFYITQKPNGCTNNALIRVFLTQLVKTSLLRGQISEIEALLLNLL